MGTLDTLASSKKYSGDNEIAEYAESHTPKIKTSYRNIHGQSEQKNTCSMLVMQPDNNTEVSNNIL